MFVLPRMSVFSFGFRVRRIPSGTPIATASNIEMLDQPEMFAGQHRDFVFVGKQKVHNSILRVPPSPVCLESMSCEYAVTVRPQFRKNSPAVR